MTKKITIAAIVFLIVGVVFITMRSRQDRDERAAAAESRFVIFNAQNVTSLEITVQEIPWRYDRVEGDWRLLSPVKDRGDATQIADLLSDINLVTVGDTMPDDTDLSQYGLDPPRAALKFEGVDAPAVYLGNVTPVGVGLYARVEGRPGVLLVICSPESFLVAPDPGRLRDRSFTGLPTSRVDGITLASANAETDLELEEDGWWIVKPRRLPASNREVSIFLEDLGEIRILAFLDNMDVTPAAAGKERGVSEITLRSGDTVRTLHVERGSEAGQLLVSRDDRGTVMLIEDERLANFRADSERFLAGRLTRINRYKVTRFEYSRGDRRFEAGRSQNNDWISQSGRTVPERESLSLLQQILEARLTGWSAPRESSGSPAAILSYDTESGESDRLVFLSDRSVVLDSLPGIVLHVDLTLPSVPEQ